MDYIKAFIIGGIICALVQILMEKTKLLPGRIMVILVCTGVALGAVNVYEPFVKWAGAGASVPLTGFGNVLWKGVKEAVDQVVRRFGSVDILFNNAGICEHKSALEADLNFLMDIQNNYKYNWNSEKYKAANHAKVLDIRQEAARQIDFYQEQIKKQLGKKVLLHSDHDVQKMLEKVQGEFKEYQLALYIYGFAYFLEVVLQENYEKAYLSAIAKRIDEMAFQYREFYSLAYSQIENLSKSSLQAHLFSGLSAINKGAGTAIAKIPGINKSQIDETLIEAGERIGAYKNRRVQTTMQQLLERQSSCVRPFIDNINAVNRLYNEPVTLIFNHDTLYLGSPPDQT